MAIQKFRGERGAVWVNSENVNRIEDNPGSNGCTVFFADGSTTVVSHQPSYVARKLNEPVSA